MMTNTLSKLFRISMLAALTTLAAANAIHAATLVVDDDGAGIAGDCDDPTVTHATLAAAIGVAIPTDTISVCPGTYPETSTHITVSDIEIVGSGIGSTVFDPGGAGIVLYVDADNVTVRDLSIQNALQGMRFEMAGGTIDATTILGVELSNMTSRGIEVHNATTVTNLLVDQTDFVNTTTGLRVSSSGHIDGAIFSDCLFDSNSIGLYEANDGGTSTMKNVLVTGCVFQNHSSYAIFLEEIQDTTIENNMFIDNRRDIQIFKWYQASVPVSNVVIRNNTMTGTTDAVFAIFNAEHSSGQTAFDGVSFTNNTAQMIGRSAVYAGAHSGDPSAGGIGWETVTIQCNSFTEIPPANMEGVRFFDPVLFPDADDETLGGASIDVMRNWWGTSDEATVLALLQRPSITDHLPILPAPPTDICLGLTIDIDIKPGSDPNCFNNDGNGVIPVAILGSDVLDVTQIDPYTLAFDSLQVAVRGKDKIMCHVEDFNGDGFDDLVCQFEDEDNVFEPGDDMATVTGALFDTTPIEGTDSICVTQ